MKQKQGAPYWPASLVTLCRILSSQDGSSSEEVAEVEEVRALMEESLQLMDDVYKLQNLQHICGALRRIKLAPATVCVSCFSMHSTF